MKIGDTVRIRDEYGKFTITGKLINQKGEWRKVQFNSYRNEIIIEVYDCADVKPLIKEKSK